MGIYLAAGVVDVVALGELLAALWKTTKDWGSQPGVWLIAAGVGIALGTLIKAPKIAEAAPDADKVDAVHPGYQLVGRLINSGPRLGLTMAMLICLLFGILDLTGSVPLRERRADDKIEQKAQDARGNKPEAPAQPVIPDWKKLTS